MGWQRTCMTCLKGGRTTHVWLLLVLQGLGGHQRACGGLHPAAGAAVGQAGRGHKGGVGWGGAGWGGEGAG